MDRNLSILAMTTKQTLHDHANSIQEAIKLSPPVAVLGSESAGVDWQTWVLVLTCIYTLLLIAHKVFQIYKEIRRYKNSSTDETEPGDLK